jgi:hypothetical protein
MPMKGIWTEWTVQNYMPLNRSKMISWIYKHIKLKISYVTDETLKLVIIKVNKPEKYWLPDERTVVPDLCNHLNISGYHAIVRD